MYDWERIALWIVVLLMALKIFMGSQMSFYTAPTPLGIMDLAEFKGIPDEIKQMYQDIILNKIMPAINGMGTRAWTSVSPTIKQQIKTEMNTWANAVVTQVNASNPVISGK
jgi:hypothetical protein